MYRGNQREIRRRLVELYKLMLVERHTLQELSQKTGRTTKQVYKDISKLGRDGCVIGSNRGTYWIET